MTEVLRSPSSVSTPTHSPSLIRSYEEEEARDNDSRRDQLSLLAVCVALFRKSFCKSDGGGGVMDISWPSDVEHVNHVTFDSFDGFLGLPAEFEPEVPSRVPSASTTVFGVSTESMQLSYDPRGNSIPTILLLMQSHLYSQGGLQAEGIFRITAGNSQEEFVRDQLNRGMIPQGTDVHCLAGLIKAWFRELPRGLLDSLSAEQVMQCQSEEDCDALVRLLPLTEAALLDWAINLMADVVQHQHFNKMNARNIAMVFAPNMTQVVDPLTALMHAVQVINFLKTLIEKKLREREESNTESTSALHMDPFDDYGDQSSSRLHHQNQPQETTHHFATEDSVSIFDTDWETSQVDEDYPSYSTYTEESDESRPCQTPKCIENRHEEKRDESSDFRSESSQKATGLTTKSKGTSNLRLLNSMTEWFEAWR